MCAIPLSQAIHYPERDGRPMAETPDHVQVMVDLFHVLKARYAGEPSVFVWGNMFLYYIEGDPTACVAPDLFLVKGVERRARSVYKLWEEGRTPSLVIEVTSRSSRKEDLETKRSLYERLGIEEYFLFDPLGDYLRPPLQGFRLAGGRYRPVRPEADGALHSQTTGLHLLPEDKRLRLRDALSGQPLPWGDEEADARHREAEARHAAEEEVLWQTRKADEQTRRADEQTRRAEQERQARNAVEERLRALEAKLAKGGGTAE